jgi:hypothetical protein
MLLCAASASASAHSTFSGSLVSKHGVVAAAPSTAQIDRALKQRTGYPASQLTTADLCPKPAKPGGPRCAAQALVKRSGHTIIHLSAGPRQRPEEMRPAGTPGISAPVTSQATPAPFTPGYLQEAYDLSWLSANRGTGDTVAVVDYGYDADAASDLNTFRSHYGLSACDASPCFQQVNEYGSSLVANMPAPDSGSLAPWHAETSLDLDAVSSICPNCNIVLVEEGDAPPRTSEDDDTSAEQTAATLGAGQISNSWTEGSTSAPSSTFTFPGVLTVASAGDDGYTGAAINNYPAALPGVVAAGGTTLAQSGTAAGRGFGESAWNDAEGATGSGCDTYEPKPTYQTDVGCAGRAGNDISADADPETGLDIVDGGQWAQYGGTSLSAPLIAAYAALIGQHSDSPAWAYTDASDLFDPVIGNDEDGYSCATAVSYICDAGVGYDGPTGNGSISGTVVTGAPGIGGSGVVSASGTSASVVGGVYPNGLDTSYYWQYGPTTSYGRQTAPVDIGSGQGVVATSDTLTGLTGSDVDFRLVATNADGTVYGYNGSASVSAAGTTAPANTSVPQIAGTAVTGQTLSTSTGTWDPAPGSLSYQWQLSTDDSTWTDITGATGVQYQVPAADPGDYLRVQVTATDSIGSTTAASPASAQVTTLVPWSSAPPQITGTALNGQTLTASTGQWAPAASEGYAYQWQRSADGISWTNITGQTAATYTLTDADVGDTIRVQVTAFDSHGAGPPASSAATAVMSTPINTSPPTITGTAQRLDTLTASAGQWSGGSISYGYQWQRYANGVWSNITDATGQTYTPAAADEGDAIRVQVTATNAAGSNPADSAATGQVISNPPTAPTAPTISGTAAVGQTLAATSTFIPSDVTVAYQWQRSSDGSNWTDIAGQTTGQYTPTGADIGDQIRAQLTATNLDAPGGVVADSNAVSVPAQSAPVQGPPATAPPSTTPPAPTPTTAVMTTPPVTTTPAPTLTTPVALAQTGTAKIAKTGSRLVKTSAKQYATAKLTAVKYSKKRKLVITRVAGITGPMTGWACQSTGKKKCLARRTLTRTASWTTTLTGPLKISVTLG